MVYRVCSISGGGVRGIIPATVIKKMVEVSKSKGGKGDIRDICDYVIGTSVGGIVAAGLVASENKKSPRYTPEEILSVIKNGAQKIFPLDANYNQHIILSFLVAIAVGASVFFILPALEVAGLMGYRVALVMIGSIAFSGYYTYNHAAIFDGYFAPKYSRDGIDNLLNQQFENLTLRDVIIPFTTVSYSLEEKNPRVWSSFKAIKTKHDNHFIKDALGATSAAPTFFPCKETIVRISDKKNTTFYDIDGGIFANSPVNIGISVLYKHASKDIVAKISQEGMQVVSIGTGYHKSTDLFIPPSSFAQGILSYGILNPLIHNVMDATEKDSIIQARHVRSAIRIDPKLDLNLMPMDKSDANHIESLSQAAESFVKEVTPILKSYTECLMGASGNCAELITEGTPDYSYEKLDI